VRRAKDSNVFAGEAKHKLSIADAPLFAQSGRCKTLLQQVFQLSFCWQCNAVKHCEVKRASFARRIEATNDNRWQRMLREPRCIVAVNRRNQRPRGP
jgi:hypothetical protein